MSELAVNAISKSLIISGIFLKEVLELRSCHLVLSLKATFILVPLLDHQSAEKQSGKRDSIESIGSSSFEVIFTLLTKLVAIQV